MRVLAVPRSIARSVLKYFETKENILIFNVFRDARPPRLWRCNIIAKNPRRIKALAALSHAFPRTNYAHRAAGPPRAVGSRDHRHGREAERHPRDGRPDERRGHVECRAHVASAGSDAATSRRRGPGIQPARDLPIDRSRGRGRPLPSAQSDRVERARRNTEADLG